MSSTIGGGSSPVPLTEAQIAAAGDSRYLKSSIISGPTNKAKQQTGTDNTVAVTPATQKDHDSAAKAWAQITQSAGVYSVAAGSNIASITKNGTGDITINFTTAFASASFALIASLNQSGTATATVQESFASRTSSSVRLLVQTTGNPGVGVDYGFSIVAFGRQ